MNIRLNQEYSLTSDEHNIILNKITVAGDKAKKPGEEKVMPYKFFTSLDRAVEVLLEHGIRRSQAKTLLNLQDEVRHFALDVIDAIKAVK